MLPLRMHGPHGGAHLESGFGCRALALPHAVAARPQGHNRRPCTPAAYLCLLSTAAAADRAAAYPPWYRDTRFTEARGRESPARAGSKRDMKAECQTLPTRHHADPNARACTFWHGSSACRQRAGRRGSATEGVRFYHISPTRVPRPTQGGVQYHSDEIRNSYFRKPRPSVELETKRGRKAFTRACRRTLPASNTVSGRIQCWKLLPSGLDHLLTSEFPYHCTLFCVQ